jgi:magnesium transporter
VQPTRPLLPLVQRYFEIDPAGAAHSLETMDDGEAIAAIRSLPPALAAEAISRMQASHATSLVSVLPDDTVREIAQRLDAHRAAGLLLQLAEERRASVLSMMPEKTRRLLRDLLGYPVNSAGRVMRTEFLALRAGTKVREAIRKIRLQSRRTAPPSYLYVLDADDRLVGVVNMRDLLLGRADDTLESVMRGDVFSVPAFMDREEIANRLAGKTFFAVPVVDAEQRMLGVVRTDDLLSDMQEEASEDILKMFGAGGDEHAFSPIRFSLRKRLPWLHVNLLTAFLAAFVVGLFEDLIARITVLAVFLPVVAGQGGNAGAQSLAVVMRGLVMREIPRDRVKALLLKETAIGTLSGVIVGLVTAAIAWAWNGNPVLGVVIGLAMVTNLIAAGFAGALIPVAMKSLGFDPSQSSSIILTTITDIVGFFSYLGFALLFESWLV